jgi:hypothetical protein
MATAAMRQNRQRVMYVYIHSPLATIPQEAELGIEA